MLVKPTGKQIRSFALRADGGQAADPTYTLRGRALTYNSLSKDLGGFKERFLPGALTRSLASGDDVKCLFQHSPDHVLGRTQNKTLQLTDSSRGLDFRCQLDPNQQAHRDLWSSVQRGDVNECSFAFLPDGADAEDWDTCDDDDGNRCQRRTVKRASLFDVSVVTSPAYGNGATSVDARKLGVGVGWDASLRAKSAAVAALIAADDAHHVRDVLAASDPEHRYSNLLRRYFETGNPDLRAKLDAVFDDEDDDDDDLDYDCENECVHTRACVASRAGKH
jgi:HK97 family phage prohead protease